MQLFLGSKREKNRWKEGQIGNIHDSCWFFWTVLQGPFTLLLTLRYTMYWMSSKMFRNRKLYYIASIYAHYEGTLKGLRRDFEETPKRLWRDSTETPFWIFLVASSILCVKQTVCICDVCSWCSSGATYGFFYGCSNNSNLSNIFLESRLKSHIKILNAIEKRG